MPFRRKPKKTKFDPEKKEFSFSTGARDKEAPNPKASKRRPPLK